MPVTISPSGPMFGLTPLVDALGGKLASDESGESITLRLADKDVVIGPGNAIITVGDTIVSLSQPPARGEGGLQVPVDFLKKTYGDLLGYSFEWHPETSRLIIARRGSREMGVTLDVVHLQGMTTVVLQFPDEPHYQIDRSQAGLIKVQMLADRLTPPAPQGGAGPARAGRSPSSPQQVRIQLSPGAQAESYVLENPFRLVFDVHPTASVEVDTTQPAERSQQAPGIHTIVIDPGHGAGGDGSDRTGRHPGEGADPGVRPRPGGQARAPGRADASSPAAATTWWRSTSGRRSPTRTRRTCSSRSTSTPRSAPAPTAPRPTS